MIFGEDTGNVQNPMGPAWGRMPTRSRRNLCMRIPRTMDRVVPSSSRCRSRRGAADGATCG